MTRKQRKGLMLFIGGAILAWIGAYGPDLWNHKQVQTALDAPRPHWVCMVSGDTVYSENQVYVTKKYILVNGQRFYSDEFRRFGRDGGFILLVINNDQTLEWMRLTHRQAAEFSARYGFSYTGCRHMGGPATQVSAAPAETYRNFTYGHGKPAASFSWEKALGLALRPVKR
ncbi:MAG: hypothetical protein HY053_05005 [Proteobacteria bacterium]|nr:hypothetical protein [Pseudomonadota bacterium]